MAILADFYASGDIISAILSQIRRFFGVILLLDMVAMFLPAN